MRYDYDDIQVIRINDITNQKDEVAKIQMQCQIWACHGLEEFDGEDVDDIGYLVISIEQNLFVSTFIHLLFENMLSRIVHKASCFPSCVRFLSSVDPTTISMKVELPGFLVIYHLLHIVLLN